MGLLGVMLDPAPLQWSKNLRFTSIIKLTRIYLEQGGKAHWLSFLSDIRSTQQGSILNLYFRKSRLRIDQCACTWPEILEVGNHEGDQEPVS